MSRSIVAPSRLCGALLLVALGAVTGPAWGHEEAGGAHGGAVVDRVVGGSPADAAGLEVGDRILSLDGRQLSTQADLTAIQQAYRPGATVPLVVERDGKKVKLQMTFGERADGGISIGVALQLTQPSGGDPANDEGTRECLAWIEKTYRIAEIDAADPKVDFSADYEAIRECVGRDTIRMGRENAVKYCDNVFKVHCTAVELLAEIAEAQVATCAGWLEASMGIELADHKAWRTCAEPKVYDRYAIDGQATDEATCRRTFVETCGGGSTESGGR